MLAALGPEDARRVMARSWAALGAGLGATAAAGFTVDELYYAAPRAVGQIVVTYRAAEPSPRPFDRATDTSAVR